LADNKR